MLENFLQNFYTRYSIKGYKIIGHNLTYQFVIVILLLMMIWLHILINEDFFSYLILFRLYIYMKHLGKLMDIKLNEYYSKMKIDSKNYIKKFLSQKLLLNHSSQYKEFAVLLKQYADENKRSYNFVPYLSMILPVLLFTSSITAQIYPQFLVSIILITLGASFFLIILNPIINTYLKLSKNVKAEMSLGLSNTVFEIYLEKSVAEYKNQTKEVHEKKFFESHSIPFS